jgi:hypothetical protein
MNDLTLLTTDDLIKELRSRCTIMVFIAHLKESEDKKYKEAVLGFEDELLGLTHNFEQNIQVDKIVRFLGEQQDRRDDEERGF